MNYRHAYHAGNFADVFKHAALSLILRYLNNKPNAWRFIDTHAGAGRYDLASEAAQRTGEWLAGVGRLAPHIGLAVPVDAATKPASAPPPEALAALEPYAEVLRGYNPDGFLRRYPGSPRIARRLARPQDRLTLTELHPEAVAELAAEFAGDSQVKVRRLDGWLALGAFVPPKERRGLVLVDPPFEEEGELHRMVSGLVNAYRRWSSGCFMLWHPVKDLNAAQAYQRALVEATVPKLLLATLLVRKPTGATLDGCGITVVNPPYILERGLRALLPYLAEALAQGEGAGHALIWLRDEHGAAPH